MKLTKESIKAILLSIDKSDLDLSIAYNVTPDYIKKLRIGKEKSCHEVLKTLTDLERDLVRWYALRERKISGNPWLTHAHLNALRDEHEQLNPRPKRSDYE